MKILVIDDDTQLNRGICTFLESNKFKTLYAFNGKEGLDILKSEHVDLIISDIQMPELDGIALLSKIQNFEQDIPIVIMTAYASVENAVEAMKNGAEDFITKPINLKELMIKIEKILHNKRLRTENEELRKKISNYEMPEILGESEVINELKVMLRRISRDPDVPIIIYGESGTGKELVAKNIHSMSERKDKPFVPINCAVLIDDLMESDLFGHVRGAFTGAIHNKVGLLESNNGGTVFLDEISEMSPRVQSKLLRVLQDGIIQPVGSNSMKQVDVRFICASNKKLSELVSEKKFRDDLYFRLSVIELEIPSLAARKKDIPILIKHFFNKYCLREKYFSSDAIGLLENYMWPGNIRELENLIRSLIVTSSNPKIDVNDLPQKFRIKFEQWEGEEILLSEDYKVALNKAVLNFEKKYIEYHLEKNNNNISKTAESINLSRVSLHKKIKELNIPE